MAERGIFAVGENINREGGAILRVFRLLTDEEQRIAYAILEGMRLQKALDSQGQERTHTTAGA